MEDTTDTDGQEEPTRTDGGEAVTDSKYSLPSSSGA